MVDVRDNRKVPDGGLQSRRPHKYSLNQAIIITLWKIVKEKHRSIGSARTTDRRRSPVGEREDSLAGEDGLPVGRSEDRDPSPSKYVGAQPRITPGALV